MNPGEQAERDAILARLAASRVEISRILEPAPTDDTEGPPAARSGPPGAFPRSRTMQMLMSGKSLGAVGATAAGLLIARPGLAWRLLRALPAGAIARMVLSRLLGGRAKR
jgi:hypothetical protein